jgi:two-component system chemotaxis response regulator CheY
VILAALPERRARVLVVDDSGYARLRIRRFLLAEGVSDIVEAADGDEALAAFEATRPSLVLLDQVMRGRDGIEVARLLRQRDPSLTIVMLTVVSDPEVHQRARGAGVDAVLEKSQLQAIRSLIAERPRG